jgi:kynurenine formamidase
MTSRQGPGPGNWGRWGTEDERGALNLVTAERVLEALRLPARGRLYSLGQPIQGRGVPMVSDRPPPIHLFRVDGGDYATGAPDSNGCRSAEDYLIMGMHGHTTHLDALGHVWSGEELYNGFPDATVRSTGMRRCGIDKAGPIATRGVLLDLAAWKEVDHLEAGETVSAADLDQCALAQGVDVGAGDAVLLRTGWSLVYASDPASYERAWPGIGLEAASWLAARDVVLVGADNPAVETRPFPEGTTAPVHQLLLRDHGIYLLELLDLEALAADAAHEFLFLTLPLRVRGATASPVNPVAIT